MGAGKKKKVAIREFTENIKSLTDIFPCVNGFFGAKGKGRSFTRNIISKTPEAEALKFFNLAGNGGNISPFGDGKGTLSRMRDGTIISYRKVSTSDGTSVVEINLKQSDGIIGEIKSQKIHFVEEKE